MNPLERIKGILLQPKAEWEVIAVEQATAAGMYRGYVAPLAAIGPVASFIGLSLIGVGVPLLGTFRLPFWAGLSSALVSFVLTLVGVFVMALVIDALAPSFQGRKDPVQALKLAVYAFTPAWLAGVFYMLPVLAILALIAALYGLYLLYLGLPILMKSPPDKSLGYTVVVVLCAIVIHVVIGAAATSVGSLGYASRFAEGSAPVPREVGDELAQLDAKMRVVSRKLEQAEQSGDVNAQIAASGEALGALLGTGGPQSQPVSHLQLKTLIPSEIPGMKRLQLESSQSGMAGVNVATAEGRYGNEGGREITLSITDMGGGRGVAMLAAWAALEQERQTDNGYEKTSRFGERVVHEEYDKAARQGSYQILVAKRFVVEGSGYDVEMDVLRQAVAKVGLAQLEALKEQVAQK